MLPPWQASESRGWSVWKSVLALPGTAMRVLLQKLDSPAATQSFSEAHTSHLTAVLPYLVLKLQAPLLHCSALRTLFLALGFCFLLDSSVLNFSVPCILAFHSTLPPGWEAEDQFPSQEPPSVPQIPTVRSCDQSGGTLVLETQETAWVILPNRI